MSNENIVWYPGHMAKAKRKIAEALPQIDAVVELLDARVPISSRNPDFDRLFEHKPRLTLLTKSLLADESATARFLSLYSKNGIALAIDCKSGAGIARVAPALKTLLAEKIQRDSERNVTRVIRVMVAGITNVGKSTFINTFAGGKKAKAEDRPGVTRSNSWISTGKGIDLMDTPGLLWHKFDDRSVAVKLACIGSVRDEILDQTALSCELISLLREKYPGFLCERYKLDTLSDDESSFDIFERIARKRGFIRSRAEIDEERCAAVFLDEFRGGKLGRITLD